MFKSFFYLSRVIYIIYVYFNNRKNIAKALESLGPSFIKLGQFLSTRPDLVGEKMAYNLSYLHDKLPCFAYSEVRKIIFSQFNKEIEELYCEFCEIPVAAASIAQVHRAITKDGTEVAVKVLRPNIEKILAKDINFFLFIAKLIDIFFPKYKRLKLVEVVRTLENSFKFETDLTLEAAAASELLEKNKLEFVKIPKVYWSLVSEKVLSIEWVRGISVYEKDKLLEANINLTHLATNFAVMFFSQAFVDGFFHADLHQGNVMVNDKGQILLVDFGIMGRLDYNNRVYVAQILNGFLNRDYDLIAKLHKQAGYIGEKCDIKLFAQSCRSIGEPIMSLPPEQISIANLLSKLFKITEDFQMETQPQLLFLQKTMIMVEGIGKILCPSKNLWSLTEPWIKQWAQENISLEVKTAKLIKRIIHQIISKIRDEI